jgi:hypothetical protein
MVDYSYEQWEFYFGVMDLAKKVSKVSLFSLQPFFFFFKIISKLDILESI